MEKAGKLIIFNNENFSFRDFEKRTIVQSIKETFNKYNADVDSVYSNCSFQEMKSIMKKGNVINEFFWMIFF